MNLLVVLSCDTCRYADPAVLDDVDDNGPAAVLLCRRHPPIMVVHEDAAAPVWPVVADSDWCGDHIPQPEVP